MTTVEVSAHNQNGKGFRAVSGEKESFGKTVGQAIDALTLQLENGDTDTLVIVQRFQPDEFFSADQQKRLGYLMQKMRDARDLGKMLPQDEWSELEGLVEAELEGSARRAEKMAGLFE